MLHIPSSSRGTTQSFFLCGTAHPIILPWHYSIIFLVWHCTSYHPPVALLNHFSCVALHIPSPHAGDQLNVSHLPGEALHIPSSSLGTAQSFFLCGAAHPIFLVWCCTSLHPPVALLNNFPCVEQHIPSSWGDAAHSFILPWYCSIIFIVWRCTSHLPGVVLHIPSSSCGTTQSLFLCGAAYPITPRWHSSMTPIFLVRRCTLGYNELDFF